MTKKNLLCFVLPFVGGIFINNETLVITTQNVEPLTKLSWGVNHNQKFTPGDKEENNFYINHLPESFGYHQFFNAYFVMDGDVFNYFNFYALSNNQRDKFSFVNKFIGNISGSEIIPEWAPVVAKTQQLLNDESKKYRYRTNLINVLRKYITTNWTSFKEIFTCQVNNRFSNFPDDLSFLEKQDKLRKGGGILKVPFLYGPEIGSKLGDHRYEWRIGQAVCMSVCSAQTKPMLKYFYIEQQLLNDQQQVYYQARGPKVKVHIKGDPRVSFHIPILLKALQTKFGFSNDDLKSIQISSEDYMMAIPTVPGQSFHFDFLNLENHHEVYKTKTVQFYNS